MCGGKVAFPEIVKEKRRNSEKRKQKSRDAARSRRSKESKIFSDLSSQLPVSQAVVSTLDKASIMRLTVGYLKVRQMMEVISSISKRTIGLDTTHVDSVFASVLSGFLLVLSDVGDIIFLSENVEEFIGIPQIEMMGQSILQYSHPCDHDDIKAVLAAKSDLKTEETLSLFVRMKTTLKPKGRSVNLKSETYQLIHYIGHKLDKPCDADVKCPTFYLVLIGKIIPYPGQIEEPLENDIFLTRHTPDMKFTHIEGRITELLGYKKSELLGQPAYIYHHALDANLITTAFKTLFAKGQCETGHYRFLSKHGGYVWVVTQATLIYENGTKPEYVVCLNHVLSKPENQHEIVSIEQVAIQEPVSEPILFVQEVEAQSPEPSIHLSSTSAIFSPKSTVMSKEFLSFPDDADILLFQEPLGKDPKLSLDLDLFQDDPCTIGSLCNEPFISYRDDSMSSPTYSANSESSHNVHLSNSTSPNHFSTPLSSPDSGSPTDAQSLDPIEEFSNLGLKFTLPPSLADPEMEDLKAPTFVESFKTPFVLMEDEFPKFPIINPSKQPMWGPQQEPQKIISERLPDPEPQRISPPKQKPLSEANMKSSLAALLQSDLKKAPQTKEKNTVSRKESALHKKWQNAENNKNNNVKQKNFASSRNYNNGHIIMLENLPVKKTNGKSNSSQRRNGHNNDHRSNNKSPFGSHTAMVQVHDRLIKVQVSVSECPPEHKQPFPSHPDPPTKRTSPSRSGPTESPKRLKLDNGLISSAPQGIATDSVLLNLLISGEDASRGYLCSGNSRYIENKYEPATLSLPSTDLSKSTDSSSSCTELLTSESELLDSFLKISQYDADLNAPIQSAHLLQGDDLLSALDHSLLRDVPTVV